MGLNATVFGKLSELLGRGAEWGAQIDVARSHVAKAEQKL